MSFGQLISSCLLGLCLTTVLPAQELVHLRSGNGFIGAQDPLVSFLAGPLDTYFPAAFVPDDFLAASNGDGAYIIARHGAWLPALPADGQAQWIASRPDGAGQGGSFLAAIDFQIATNPIGTASIDFFYACDNLLGGGPTQGLYLNGTALSGNTSGGSFSTQYSFHRTDIGPLLQTGLNTLYICSTDQGGPGGLLFAADLEVNEGQTVGAEERPAGFGIAEIWPNPFNPVSNVKLVLPETGFAQLQMVNLQGQEVSLLHQGMLARGEHRFQFNAAGLPSGIYFARLKMNKLVDQRKLLLLK